MRHIRFAQAPQQSDQGFEFTVENAYLKTGSEAAICREICRYRLAEVPAGVLMWWDSTFHCESGEFIFGDQEEMGLGVRLATPLAVASGQGGRILNSRGDVDERGVWGKQARWCDYSRVDEDGRLLGILVMPDPKNFRQSWFHARDYGFVTANPFGRHAFTDEPASRVVVPKGLDFHLGFALLLHATEPAETFRPEAILAEIWDPAE